VSHGAVLDLALPRGDWAIAVREAGEAGAFLGAALRVAVPEAERRKLERDACARVLLATGISNVGADVRARLGARADLGGALGADPLATPAR